MKGFASDNSVAQGMLCCERANLRGGSFHVPPFFLHHVYASDTNKELDALDPKLDDKFPYFPLSHSILTREIYCFYTQSSFVKQFLYSLKLYIEFTSLETTAE